MAMAKPCQANNPVLWGGNVSRGRAKAGSIYKYELTHTRCGNDSLNKKRPKYNYSPSFRHKSLLLVAREKAEGGILGEKVYYLGICEEASSACNSDKVSTHLDKTYLEKHVLHLTITDLL